MTGPRRHLPRLVSGLALAAVAGVTGVISYSHIYALTVQLHQPVMVARLMPFGVDGLIVVGSVVLLSPPPGQRWLGWVCLGPGAAISLTANVASGARYGAAAAGWAGIPAVAFTLATWTLERWLRAQVPAPEPVPVPASAPSIPVAAPSMHRPAPAAPVHDASAPAVAPRRAPAAPAVDASALNGLREESAALFAPQLASGRVPGIRAIQAGLHVGPGKARRVQDYLRTRIP